MFKNDDFDQQFNRMQSAAIQAQGRMITIVKWAVAGAFVLAVAALFVLYKIFGG